MNIYNRVVKNGGAVQFSSSQAPIKEYNILQAGNYASKSKLRVVDATNSSIMALGFDHFKGCTEIEKIILHQCKHMENDALEKLGFLKNSLKELQVTNCGNVEENGLLTLKQLGNLETLKIHGFPYIKDLNSVVNKLKADLPRCNIITDDK